MTHQAIVSPSMAEEFDLEVGDTVYLGGQLQTPARMSLKWWGSPQPLRISSGPEQ